MAPPPVEIDDASSPNGGHGTRGMTSRHPGGRREGVAAWDTRSTHGAAVYETLLYADGRLSCNCPAWFNHWRESRCWKSASVLGFL